ncbi:MAG: 4-alpha-glucanotransferase, partial [Parachlamydiaceae bacterium]
HDSEPLRLWWQRYPWEVEEFCRFKNWIKTEQLSQSMLKSILTDSHHTHSRFTINLLLEYLSLVPELCDANVEQDRINVPGTVTQENWTYRMKPYIEDMVENTQLNHAIHEILSP